MSMTALEHANAFLRGYKRWFGLVAFVLLLTVLLPRRDSSPGTVRKHVGALIGNVDYSPYSQINGFEHFKQTPDCSMDSLQLYRPTKALCRERASLMSAMSEGGRIGFDAPYQTRDCDMRWFTTPELCTILSRFSAVHIVGDSMMRHLAQSINLLLREDLPNGARSTWRSGNPDKLDCTCHTLFDNHDCDTEGFVAIGTDAVYTYDAPSMKCPQSTTAVVDFLPSTKDPPQPREIEDFKKQIKSNGKGEAFVFGQGGWDDFEIEPAQRWVNAFETALGEAIKGFEPPPPPVPPAPEKGVDPSKASDAGHTTGVHLNKARRASPASEDDWRTEFIKKPRAKDLPHRLWISPNAQGLHKNPFFVLGQNNIKLMTFERDMRAWLDFRGFDVLGMFNLTVQSESLDGTHASMEANLVKAMMVFNWLDWAGREEEGA